MSMPPMATRTGLRVAVAGATGRIGRALLQGLRQARPGVRVIESDELQILGSS